MKKIPVKEIAILGAIGVGGYLVYKSGIFQGLASIGETIGGITRGIQNPVASLRTGLGIANIHDRWDLAPREQKIKAGEDFMTGIQNVVTERSKTITAQKKRGRRAKMIKRMGFIKEVQSGRGWTPMQKQFLERTLKKAYILERGKI